jgi:pimeloyl-ACP methyl ester carboxylesterase
VRHHATGATPGAPVFFLAGGPGGSIMGEPAALLAAPDAYQRLIASHDLVFIDQRGAGTSVPALTCPELAPTTAQGLSVSEPSQQEIDQITVPALRACHERLVAEGVNLDAFNSVENAADIKDAAAAFGYDKVILYGQS